MAQTIEEFVISLGLKVDKAAEQRFTSALGGLGKTFAVLAAGLAATAATIQATVVAVSKSFDNLYFAAQRTNSTVAGIKSLSYAFTQIGGTADEAMGAISGLAKAMRTNPGVEKWLNAQGIKTAGKDVKQILMDAADVFSKKDYPISNQFAEMIGIPEETWNKWVKNKDQIRKFEEEQEATQRRFGVDPKKAAESSNELMTKFRSLTMELGVLFEKITVALQPQLNQLMADISKWFEEHQDQVVKILNQILEAVKGLITDFGSLLKALQPVGDMLLYIGGLIAGEKDGLKGAMEAVLFFFTTIWAVQMVLAIAKVTREVKALFMALNVIQNHPVLKTLSFLIQMLNYDAIQGFEPMNGFDPSAPSSGPGVMDRAKGLWEKYGYGGSYWNGGNGSATGASSRPGLTKITTKSGKTAWVPTKGAAQFQGFLNDYEAAGGKIDDLQGFNDRDVRGHPGVKSAHGQEGAIDINPLPSNPFDVTRPMLPQTGELANKWGVGWGGDWYSRKDWGHFSLREREGGRLLSPDELKALQDEQAARLKDKHSELFGAPALGSSSARLASISNRTSITVYGSSDPAGTAANLNGAQSRVASELIRNGQSAFV